MTAWAAPAAFPAPATASRPETPEDGDPPGFSPSPADTVAVTIEGAHQHAHRDAAKGARSRPAAEHELVARARDASADAQRRQMVAWIHAATVAPRRVAGSA